ncbi:MAG: hypothetical protein P1U89_16210 [Verrucomicrobiales bacterium]|nr:hypothetical protein [Verrucomicrobiales bacterium]
MKNLSQREKVLLLACFLVIFVMGNLFAIRFMKKNWGGGESEVTALEQNLADLEMWLEDSAEIEAKDRWLRKNAPRENSMTKAQGDLLQFLQDDLFERKIKIEKQTLQEPDSNDDFQEVAVSLRVRGAEKDVIEWLTTLQGAKKFQVIKALEFELDRKSREEEPQAVCQIVLARWFAPIGQEPFEEMESPEVTEEVVKPVEETAASG